MDLRSTLFPGKTQPSKPRAVQKLAHASKSNAHEPQISRQKRVFGTVRNLNIPAKTMTDKPIKPSISDDKTGPKSTKIASNRPVETSKNKNNSTEKCTAKLKKKSTCISKRTENNPSISQAQNFNDPATPVASRSLNRSRIVTTPYYSAGNCSKCRFDRLETASYWLGQIKLAESVSKHFVSASFFRLASESKAEPIRKLRNELKRYLLRHEHLRKGTEWMEVSLAYGLLKEDENSNIAEKHNLVVIEAADASIDMSNDIEQDQKKLKELDEAERN